MTIRPIQSRGITLEVGVDEGGVFYTTLSGVRYTDTHYKGLIEQIDKATKQERAKVTVPFVVIGGDGPARGTAYGVHASSGQVLARFGDGPAKQLRTYGEYLASLNDADMAELTVLYEAKRKADAELEAFKKAHVLHLHQAVEIALARTTGTGSSES
jgi:hypothetical protein